MSVVYNQTLKNTRMASVTTALGNAALLKIANSTGFTNATDVLATITLASPSSTTTSDVLTIAGTPLSVAASFTGTATQAKITAAGGTDIITGLTVGTSGTNIVLNTTSITAGQTVRLDSGTITHG